MSTEYRKLFPGTQLDYFDIRAVVDAIQLGVYDRLPYTARVQVYEPMVEVAFTCRLDTAEEVYMRGGTSKGVFFRLQDLPEAAQSPGPARDALLLRVIGSTDPYGKQTDGMGGATSSTSKTVILSKSTRPDHDVGSSSWTRPPRKKAHRSPCAQPEIWLMILTCPASTGVQTLLVQHQVGTLDDFLPLRAVGSNETGEFLWRHRKRLIAMLGEVFAHFRGF